MAPQDEYIKSAEASKDKPLPSVGTSLAPIILPLVLIFLNTGINAMFPDTTVAKVFKFVGSPLAALLAGCLFSLVLTGAEWRSKKVMNDWVESALRSSAMPIMVTAMGGALAAFIKNAGVANAVAETVVQFSIPGIIIPILIAALIHVITGSNALGVMTAAALVEPMLGALGISPLAAFLACGTGALMFKHANSSGFWVTVTMSNMDIRRASALSAAAPRWPGSPRGHHGHPALRRDHLNQRRARCLPPGGRSPQCAMQGRMGMGEAERIKTVPASPVIKERTWILSSPRPPASTAPATSNSSNANSSAARTTSSSRTTSWASAVPIKTSTAATCLRRPPNSGRTPSSPSCSGTRAAARSLPWAAGWPTTRSETRSWPSAGTTTSPNTSPPNPSSSSPCPMASTWTSPRWENPSPAPCIPA